ncbi:hypothetical protein ACOMHN_028769 [Nucella lapillus]
MSDTPAKPSSRSDSQRHGGGGNRHHSDSATPTATRSSKPPDSTTTPARPGSALNARLTNSTPRARLRPAPVRSLSTPLGRSLSMRMSKKEKRLSMRLEDPTSPASSTYRDDYQSPEALSLQSLNLETTTVQDSEDLNAPTTYRESYQWSSKFRNKGQSRSKPDSKDTAPKISPTSPDHGTNGLPSCNGPVSPSRSESRNGQTSEVNSSAQEERLPPNRPVIIQPPTSARSSRIFERNLSLNATGTQNERHTLSSAHGKSLSNEDRIQTKPANENGTVITKPSNRNGQSVNDEGGKSTGAPPTQKLTNGVRGRDVPTPVSEDRTPRRVVRAYQLQSSNGGSPFAYGSDSGSWV